MALVGLLVALMTMSTVTPVAAATEVVTGTATGSGGNGFTTADLVYSSPGVLGSGTIHVDFVVVSDPPGSRTEGTGLLTRSDGATLAGIETGTVMANPAGRFDVVAQFTVTSGTGALAGVTGEIVFTGTVSAPGSSGGDVFTMTGTLTTPSPVAIDKDQCKDGGWQNLVDDQGKPFRNQGHCVSFSTSTLLRVVDGEGNPFPAGSAGVQACGGAGYPACDPHVVAVDTDGDGNVRLGLDPTTLYTINAFAMNTGWPDPWVSPDGTEFHFSATVTLLGADLADGTVFVVPPPSTETPTGTVLRVVDGQGNPFPAGTAGVQACGGAGDPACDPHVVAVDTDGDGNVGLELDPTTPYTINAFAMNTGWPDPWVSPDGTEFHFSATVTLLGSDLQNGTVFVVAPPGGDVASDGGTHGSA